MRDAAPALVTSEENSLPCPPREAKWRAPSRRMIGEILAARFAPPFDGYCVRSLLLSATFLKFDIKSSTDL